ncbi:monovalent cation:proton antiporter family protein [Rossellomorea marisflavi]|jgi:monovalent cation:H+ antiporter-2, CPA2 family|uniref:monovalent cation:proton antiporter family protein n=1 Tax=Rossellomorea marisflavi TaxID=189381 RepID=UPI0006F2496B|nr:monovalent cation:proton antiporter family protein [Rossellomorea marisflavi]KQU60627.1 sodium:proton antiporter [Bacillus sp. Leaf406]MCM2590511.1 monovalent cation:proton antiporter family protein [Rossellomorea marisflavi]MDR4937452.1 monovalent cation:proton antiporter family protein [Rossellomorea marisflavi]MDW4526209.1 monovalent cation:proton antiporter family protein [Rossellomorea marisflavi]UTE71361.1 monovalent cation:proton antiporter family protein [Rossellomorea marisflavi]
MEQHASVTSLVIVILVAFLTPILLHKFKLNFIPVVIAEIIVGLIIGKSGFDIVHQDMWLETLSTLGFIFLMFLSGLEIDFTAFSGGKKKKALLPNGKEEPNRLRVAMIIFLGIFVVSLGLSYLFVWFGLINNAFLMTLIISTISLGVVVPTLKEAHIMKTAIGQIILLVAVIADLATMILLAVFVSLYGDGQGSMWLLLILFGVGILLYFLARRLKNNPFIRSLSTGTVQIGTRAVFTLIIVLVAISETVGAENILGAFLAGVLVSLLAPNQEMVHKLDSFGYGFLIPIFFVMIGVELDLWTLLSDKKMLLLIPLLLLAFFISKVVPVYFLKYWYDTKTTLASAFLLTSTLSLVIAAAKIAERIEIITPQMSGTLILVAVIACIITPIFFKKLFPKESAAEKKLKVSFLGANQLTMPVSRELQSSLYEPVLYHTRQDKSEQTIADSLFTINEIENYDSSTIEALGIFDSDILVISTGDEALNASLAVEAKAKGVDRVIVRAESADLHEDLREKEIEVYSVFLSTKALLRALIESPSVLNILTNQETSLYEIRMLNHQFEGMSLRQFPFTGDVIFVRIFRGKDSIVPHGDTELHMNDRLIVTGSKEYVDELKRELEFCEDC